MSARFSLVLLGGFLGAGKTTTMLAAARLLESRGRRVAVITNDQGDRLVDTGAAVGAAAAVDEVAGGCFCCRFEDFAGAIERVVEGGGVDTVIAEAVGSCADLQATVVRPLRRLYAGGVAVAPLTVLVEPARLDALADDTESDLAYLAARQLEEADVIGLNKADTRSPATVRLMARLLADAYPAAEVVPYSARDGTGLADLVATWARPSPPARDLEIDYDRYARAEAELGWLNTDIEIESAASHPPDRVAEPRFEPAAWAASMLAHVSEETERRGYLVGHVKLAIGGLTGSVVAAGERPYVRGARSTVERETALVNARVACAPAELDALVAAAAARADHAAGTRSRLAGVTAFSPAYPRPVHRVEARCTTTPTSSAVPTASARPGGSAAGGSCR
jgi:G3E family GTPase